ncbi:unnamed protein product, partial [Discosporangium mesarthrocarpum]
GTSKDLEELKRRRKAGEPAFSVGADEGGERRDGDPRGTLRGPLLIVAPASVVAVWTQHLNTWGFFEERHLQRGDQLDGVMECLQAGRAEVVVTSYSLMRSTIDYLRGVQFEAVFFDEYHTIKSSTSAQAQAACTLQTNRVFGLTGTLIQNDMQEFWFLMQLIDPHAVGDQAKFKEHFADPVKRARAMNACDKDRWLGNKRLEELNKIRDKHMIRRTKESELGDVLKGKSDMVVFCDLSPIQREIYMNILSMPEFQMLARAKELCDCGRKRRPLPRARCCHTLPLDDSAGDGISSRAVLWRRYHPKGEACPKCPFCCQLTAVTKLQQVANHPCLLQARNLLDTKAKREEQREFAKEAFTRRAREVMGGLVRSQNFLEVARADICGKMASLAVLLERFRANNDKVLLFSWSTAMLDVLE